MSFKIGVVGCGGFAEYAHGPAQVACAAQHPDLVLAACCDLDASKASAYARKFGFRSHYSNLEDMLRTENLDAVLALVAPSGAAAVAAAVIRQGIPLLLEKPPGLVSSELEDLISAAEANSVPVQVAFNRRYMPLMREAKRILLEDFPAIMEIQYEMIRYGRDDPDFSTTAIHAIDAAQFLAGSPYRHAEILYRTLPSVAESRSNFSIQAELESEVQVGITIQPMAGLNAESFAIHAVGASLIGQLFCRTTDGTHGRLVYWQGNRQKVVFTDEGYSHSERLGVQNELVAFCEAIREGYSPTPTLQDSRGAVRLMEAVRNRESRPIVGNRFPSPVIA